MSDVSHPLICFGIDGRCQPPTFSSAIDARNSRSFAIVSDVSHPLISFGIDGRCQPPTFLLLLMRDIHVPLLLISDVSHPLISFGIDGRCQLPTFSSAIDARHSRSFAIDKRRRPSTRF
jgi:hypothetical protein